MLPKSKRLARVDFQARSLRTIPFAYGSIKILPGPAKAGVVISKKVSARAADRNLLRRRIYAIVRPLLLGKAEHASLAVYPNKKAAAASFSELKTEIKKAFSR